LYTSDEIVLNIRRIARQKEIKLGQMLSDCGLNKNTLAHMTDKRGISCFSLAKIADYLDCSVDYLLGRTDNANSHKGEL